MTGRSGKKLLILQVNSTLPWKVGMFFMLWLLCSYFIATLTFLILWWANYFGNFVISKSFTVKETKRRPTLTSQWNFLWLQWILEKTLTDCPSFPNASTMLMSKPWVFMSPYMGTCRSSPACSGFDQAVCVHETILFNFPPAKAVFYDFKLCFIIWRIRHYWVQAGR